MSTKTLDLVELCKGGRYFSEKRGDKIHIIDSLTGASYAIFADHAQAKLPSRFVEATLPDGTIVWSQENLNLVTGGERDVEFSPLLIDRICQDIAEGGSLTKICKKHGMPTYTTLCKWRRQHPWIDEHLAQARRDRAEYLRDEALSTALASDEDTVASSSLKHEAYKWAAGVDDGKYSPKAKVEATITAPTQIIVATGIDRVIPEKDVTPVTKLVEEKKDAD